MNGQSGFEQTRGASLALLAGGLLMAGLWLVYTNVHGPTSFDETNAVLGRSTLFWGMLLGGVPNLCIALALLLGRRQLTGGAGWLARLGYTLTLIGLIVPAAIDLAIRALGPPFFVPLVGLGLVLLAAGIWRGPLPRSQAGLLLAIGLCQLAAFALALVPNAIADAWGGYRLYGAGAHLLTGLGWAALGAGHWLVKAPAAVQP